MHVISRKFLVNMYLLTATVLAFCMGCGEQPDNSSSSQAPIDHMNGSPESPISLTLKFAKNNPQSFSDALSEASLELQKKHQPAFNQILKRMNLKYTIKNLWVQNHYANNSFQAVKLGGDFLEFRNDDKQPFLRSFSSLTRKLVWPDLRQDAILQLKAQHNDLVFAETGSPSDSLSVWKIQTSYPQFLYSIISNAYSFTLRLSDSGKSLYEKLDYKGYPPPASAQYCQSIPELLTNFIVSQFSDLGEVKNIICSVEEAKKDEYFFKLSFKLGGKQINIQEERIFHLAFYDIVEQLFLLRYDSLFTKS